MRPVSRNYNIFLILLGFGLATLLACAGPGSRYSQAPGARPFGERNFIMDTYNLISSEPGKSHLHINVDIPYSNIQFEKIQDGFLARFEVSFLVLDNKNARSVHDVLRQVRVDEFGSTSRRDLFERISKSFDLDPGTYELVVTVRDKNALMDDTQRKKIELKDFTKQKLSVSDVLLFGHEDQDSIKAENVLALYTGKLPDKVFAFVQIQAAENQDSIKFSYQLENASGAIAIRKEYDFTITNVGDWVHFEFPRDKLLLGQNLFKIRISNAGEKDEVIKTIFFKWTDIARSPGQMEQAIEQLRYLVPDNELNKVRKSSELQKKAWFDDFWKKRDPNPTTPENELQEEYYMRVNEANISFGESFTPGWQTDRGRIYILFGTPDSISREASRTDVSVNYEIWRYDRISRTFVFRENFGGRYWLISETS